MTRTVEQRMLDAESAGIELSVAELGEPAEAGSELARMATGPMAPLAATALARAVREDPGDPWAQSATAFTRGLAGQTSVLALADTVAVLLDDGPIAALVAPTLHTTLVQSIDQSLQDAPVIAAHQLEGALRVALSGASSPYLVLDRLTRPIDGLPPEYVEKLPRLVGIALDVWSGAGLADPLRATLRALQDDETADADATYELACQQMGLALRMVDSAQAVGGLRTAVDMFAQAVSLDEARDDAGAYRAVCQSVIAFAERDRPALADASRALIAILSRRDAWHLNTHQPRWRSAARDAERQWLGLVMDLRAADERLSEASWLETTAALGQLARVYDAERTIQPAPGLTAMIRPAVETDVARNAVLLDQLARAVEADRQRDRSVLPSAADAILAAVRERRMHPPIRDGGEADSRDQDRINRLAPSLRVLGAQVCQSLADLDDETLADAGAVVASLASVEGHGHRTLTRMRDQIVSVLEDNPRFRGEVRAAVTVLLERTLTFLLDRYQRGGPLRPGMPDLIRQLKKGDPRPVEAELQLEFLIWLSAPWDFAGRVHCEESDIATGRVDVIVRFGDIELVTEVKRELTNAAREALERAYLAQAAQYSGANEPFSQLLVLDLTDHSKGVRPLEDLAWAVERRVDEAASPQHVVVGVVVGNRPTPRRLSPS